MARALVLVIAVLLLVAQKGDSKPSARAVVCQNRECSRSGPSGFEPATIRVSYYVPAQSGFVRAQGGLYCSSGYESESELEIDRGQQIRMARDVPAGACVAVIAVLRSDGSIREGTSQPVRVIGVD